MFDIDAPTVGLPAAAVAKLQAMQEEREAAYALTHAAGDRMRDANANLLAAERALSEMEQAGRRAAKDFIEQARSVRDNARAAVAQRRQRYDALGQEAQAVGACLQNIEGWLRKHASEANPFQPYERYVAPVVRRGETAAEAVERVRRAIAETKSERHRVASAPLPLAEAKVALRRQIDTLAEAGAPDVAPILEGAELRLPTGILRDHPGAILNANAPNAVALVAWLHRDALLARLDLDLAAIANETAAVPSAKRASEDQRLRVQLLQLEREEEALIEQAGRQAGIKRRPDADPRAVLSLGETVPGYAY